MRGSEKHRIFFVLPPQRALIGDVLRLLAFALLVGSACAGPAFAQTPELRLEGAGPVLREVRAAYLKGDLFRAVFQRDLVFMFGGEEVKPLP